MKRLTVFTPTYNRKELLGRVYESLEKQSVKDFIWLVVDDGSTDGTGEFIDSLASRESEFEIIYHYRENGGKMRAHNTGSKLCETELFVCLDSDDIFFETAVEDILKTWEEKGSELSAGIVAYKGEVEKGRIRKFRDAAFPEDKVKEGSSTLKGLYRAGFYGETTLVFRNEMLKRHPFPEIDGEKYVPEDYVYDQIDKEQPLIILPKVLTVCELESGGYTDMAKSLRQNNPTGWFLYYEQRCADEPWSVLKIKYLSHYLRFCDVLGKKQKLSIPEYLIALPGALALKIAGKT